MALTRDKRNMFFLIASILALISLYNFISSSHIMREESRSLRKKPATILLPVERVEMYQTKEYRSRESIARKQEAGNVTTTEGNPRVYFDIEIGGNAAGRLEFVLFADKVPLTAENFRALASGNRGSSPTGNRLWYKGTVFHRIIPGFVCQGGDVTARTAVHGQLRPQHQRVSVLHHYGRPPSPRREARGVRGDGGDSRSDGVVGEDERSGQRVRRKFGESGDYRQRGGGRRGEEGGYEQVR